MANGRPGGTKRPPAAIPAKIANSIETPRIGLKLMRPLTSHDGILKSGDCIHARPSLELEVC